MPRAEETSSEPNPHLYQAAKRPAYSLGTEEGMSYPAGTDRSAFVTDGFTFLNLFGELGCMSHPTR